MWRSDTVISPLYVGIDSQAILWIHGPSLREGMRKQHFKHITCYQLYAPCFGISMNLTPLK